MTLWVMMRSIASRHWLQYTPPTPQPAYSGVGLSAKAARNSFVTGAHLAVSSKAVDQEQLGGRDCSPLPMLNGLADCPFPGLGTLAPLPVAQRLAVL